MKLPSFRSRADETTNTDFFAYVISRKRRKLQQAFNYVLTQIPKIVVIRFLFVTSQLWKEKTAPFAASVSSW